MKSDRGILALGAGVALALLVPFTFAIAPSTASAGGGVVCTASPGICCICGDPKLERLCQGTTGDGNAGCEDYLACDEDLCFNPY